MFKIDLKTNKLSITKGDNAEIVVKVFDSDDIERGVYDDDTVVLTVRKTADSDVVLTKTAIKGTISFVPADTKTLSVGSYIYDIQLTTFGGKIYTIVPASYFVIEQEVTQ